MNRFYLQKPNIAFGILLLGICLSLPPAYATHEAGNTLCYEYLYYDNITGKHIYKITGYVYRDVAGINLPSTLPINIFNDDTAHSYFGSKTLPLISTDTLSPLAYVCTYDPTLFNTYIYEEGIYEDTLGLPSTLIGFDLVSVSCCRNNGITNLANAGGQSWTMHTTIPPYIYTNSSPCFLEPITPFNCANTLVNFSNIVRETDGDSLVFSFEAPYADNQSPPVVNTVTYNAGYSVTMPFGQGGTATIDPVTGVASIFAPNTGFYVLCVQVKEYRNNILLSTVRKDMQVVVYNCTVIYSDCVWPGDANSDGIANYLDFLPIGIAFGDTGSIRPGASTDWYAQNAPDWTDTFAFGPNYKHADCNGDSIINEMDANVVYLNYGNVHSKSQEPATGRMTDPPLQVKLAAPTIPVGGNTSFSVEFGSGSLPATDVYGIAFRIYYNPLLIDSGSVSVDFSKAWLGDASSNMITLAVDQYDNGQIDIALTRIDHINQTGSGEIARIDLKVIDDLAGTGYQTDSLDLTIGGVKIIANNEDTIAFNPIGNSLEIYEGTPPDTSTGMGILPVRRGLTIYPNPADDVFHIDPGQLDVRELVLYDPMGRVHFRQTAFRSERYSLPSKAFKPGLYFVAVRTGKGWVAQRISIIR